MDKNPFLITHYNTNATWDEETEALFQSRPTNSSILNAISLDYDTIMTSPAPTSPTREYGVPVAACNGPRSWFHRLTCGHTITSSAGPTPCGTNCLSPQHVAALPFFCPCCHAEAQLLYPDLKYRAHAATLSPGPTLPEYVAWFNAGLAVEQAAFALLNNPRVFATHRPCRATEFDGEPIGEDDFFRRSWVDFALPAVELPLPDDDRAPADEETVTVDSRVWDLCPGITRELILRMAYNVGAHRTNGFAVLKKMRIVKGNEGGWIKPGTYLRTVMVEGQPPEVEQGLTEEEEGIVRDIELDLETVGMLTQATRVRMMLI